MPGWGSMDYWKTRAPPSPRAPGYAAPATFSPMVASPDDTKSPLDMQRQTIFSPMTAASGQQLPQFRGQQQDVINMLSRRAAGQGVSPAEIMLNNQLNRAQANTASAVNSARGINPGLQARMILRAHAEQAQQAVGQGAQLRAQEQLAAQGLLANTLGQARGQDIGQFGVAGGLQNQQTGVAAQTSAADIERWLNLMGSAAGAGGQAAMGFGLGRGNVPAAHGGEVLDSPRNDTVPAMLSPGEIVLPRSVAQAEDAPEAAKAFVRAIQRRRESEEGQNGYGRVLQANRRAYWRGGSAAC